MDASYNQNGELTNLSTCTFNTKGIQTSQKYQQYNNNGSVRNVTETIYDSYGRPVKQLEYHETVLYKINVYFYDRKGRLIKEEFVIPNDTVEYILNYKYNKMNLLTEDLGTTSEINDEGKRIYYIDRKNKYNYDKNGNEIELILFVDNKEVLMANSVYDIKGNRIERNNYEKNGSLRAKDIYKYDNRGNNIETKAYTLLGQFTFKTTYDVNDNPIADSTYNAIGPVRATKYEYSFHEK